MKGILNSSILLLILLLATGCHNSDKKVVNFHNFLIEFKSFNVVKDEGLILPTDIDNEMKLKDTTENIFITISYINDSTYWNQYFKHKSRFHEFCPQELNSYPPNYFKLWNKNIISKNCIQNEAAFYSIEQNDQSRLYYSKSFVYPNEILTIMVVNDPGSIMTIRKMIDWSERIASNVLLKRKGYAVEH